MSPAVTPRPAGSAVSARAVTPATFSSPTAPAGYAWEATSEEVAARYGVPIDDVRRFDLNTSPAPPPLAGSVLRTARFDVPLSEYPPSDYRRLAAAAAAAYGCSQDELIVGAGADEILDLCAKAFLSPGRRGVVPDPTYPMYRILTEQRGAEAVSVPRRGPSDGYTLDVAAVRAAARTADVVWLCDPNNPTGRPEPGGAIATLLEALIGDAERDARRPPTVVLDEAYVEFVGQSQLALRNEYPRLVVVRTLSKAYALAGLRVGFGIATPDLIAELAPYRPPGSVSVPSLAVAAAALADGVGMQANVAAVSAERTRLAAALDALGWRTVPSVTNFVLVRLGSPARVAAAAEALLSRGLVPRTFGAGHPLAGFLRLTVRTASDDDLLLDAARAFEAGPGGER